MELERSIKILFVLMRDMVLELGLLLMGLRFSGAMDLRANLDIL